MNFESGKGLSERERDRKGGMDRVIPLSEYEVLIVSI